ncbi:hypothetical protein JCM19240_6833 [Vibrio maritimus]|uniref:Uncharacterized protein n=1 Tax=Vibrio maritimus TaxID=990268 RepID=A0A090TCI7_9VIBR|nr:hypothetical protein JCM19240_6833 [Vibrio maritimus]
MLQTTLLALIYQLAGREETARQYWNEAEQSVIDINAIAAQQLDVMILDDSLRATLEHARLSLANATD